MSVALFPPELIHLVMENLKSERISLHALTLTSKGLRLEATRLLYLSMTDTSGTAHYRFLLTIRRNPIELAPLVRKYHAPSIPHEQRGHLWGLVRRCLTLMVNLKELAFHEIIGSPVQIFPSFGKGRKIPFQLDKFMWTVPGHAYDQQIYTFLKAQPGLIQLRWETSYSMASSVPKEACPKIKSFEGRPSAIRLFLPSRSISELYWREEWAYYGFNQIGIVELKEFGALRGLSVETSSISNSIMMQPLFKESPFLEVLEVRFSVAHSESDWMNLREILPKFPRLKKLVITTSKPFTQFSIIRDNPTSEVGQIFAQCLHLKYVDILWNSGWVYRRWVNGGPLPNLLSIKRDRLLKFE